MKPSLQLTISETTGFTGLAAIEAIASQRDLIRLKMFRYDQVRGDYSSRMTQSFLNTRVVGFLALSMVPLRGDSIPEIVAKAKPAIVEIVAMDEDGLSSVLPRYKAC